MLSHSYPIHFSSLHIRISDKVRNSPDYETHQSFQFCFTDEAHPDEKYRGDDVKNRNKIYLNGIELEDSPVVG
jgi:hypothetical protein